MRIRSSYGFAYKQTTFWVTFLQLVSLIPPNITPNHGQTIHFSPCHHSGYGLSTGCSPLALPPSLPHPFPKRWKLFFSSPPWAHRPGLSSSSSYISHPPWACKRAWGRPIRTVIVLSVTVTLQITDLWYQRDDAFNIPIHRRDFRQR